MRPQSSWDVVIVGSGPAGSSAALALAKHGARVAVLEKAPLPRYKTCGGGIVRRATKLLPLDIREAVERSCDRAEVHFPGTGLHFATHRPEPMIAMTMRDRFDFLLASAARDAGADLQADCEVLEIAHRGDTVELTTSRGRRDARFVVAADGAISGVARKTGWPESRRLVPAVECEVFVEDGLLERLARAARFDVGIPSSGYGWVFPKKEHLSIGVLSMRRGPVNLRAVFQYYLRFLGVEKITQLDEHGFVIPVGVRREGFVKRRVLLAGDAAGFVDPVTGEGISFAIQSGQMAAWALAAGDFEEERVRQVYESELARTILPELRVGSILAKLTYASPWLRTSLARLNGSRFSEALTDVFTGERTYRESVRDPSSYLKLFRRRRSMGSSDVSRRVSASPR